MANSTLKIIEEEHKYHENLLDIMGRDFANDHEKGLSEWIKNSADAYIRKGTPDSRQFVIIHFIDSDKDDATIECVDFVGMRSSDIKEAFRVWGDPRAAKRETGKSVYGGHGNGGKFYMRQMFKEAYFVTYFDGKLNVYGFNNKGRYGFFEHNKGAFEDIETSPQEAIKYAKISKIIPAEIKDQILAGRTGFTVVRGVGPKDMKNKIRAVRVSEQLLNHPQARRVLSKIPVSVYHNGVVLYDHIVPKSLPPKPGFEGPYVIKIPPVLEYERNAEKFQVKMQSDRYPQGHLELNTSELALERNSKYGDLNCVDIIGSLSVVATYKIQELNLANDTQAVFIYGECACPILEDETDSSVSNDRVKLLDSPRKIALLKWISEQVDALAGKIAEQERKNQEKIEKEISSEFNDFLNQWKNKFMSKLFDEVLTGPGEGPGVGFGLGGRGGGVGSIGKGSGERKSNSGDGDAGGGGGR